MKEILQEKIQKFPNTPGVYFFYGKNQELLYVGKATSLKSRVKSYFLGKRGTRAIEAMIDKVENIKYKQTDSVLEAVILEANYIRDKRPKYNVLGKDDKSWNYILITKDSFPLVKTMREHEFKQLSKKDIKQFQYLFGPYPGLNTKATLVLLRKLFQFSSCSPSAKRPCLYYQMGQCLGVCAHTITEKEYKQQVIGPLVQFLSGKKKRLIKILEKRMKKESSSQNFEEAARLRNQIFRLQRIHDVAILNKSFFEDERKSEGAFSRIEGYDISNLGTTGKVGSMVVFENGLSKKSDYRKFKIKTILGQSDVDCLEEVMVRRLKHTEWKYPDLFLIDGGKPQVNRVKRIFQTFGVDIPVIGIAKGPARKKNEFIFAKEEKNLVHWVYTHQDILIQVRDEAHRFAVTYQRSLRKIKK
ncbi:MAG: hypothetical protein COV59_01935 [Candidatus Magasanikbacteria bacterium CG11_big_fil_rev_8_21_14_0_20_39_34]|uniref:Excinuclease ABC subunit C n=1 Tax=Candidatus Magasanikbacteria bacterium CG11_big_fil_rev_8_21_14_0_20_39_34 TaxID=1974653 RepID=A0A2H0N756_9BACT|nr:MAG: hypothetical protein COV59_01935 [Candidatus Magasanikbacteria bacterium CG11_big_fil_rev_8_21_14_0_20_39_34]